MKGTFRRKSFWNILWLVCGLFLTALFIVLKYADSNASNGVYVGMIFGLIICICSSIFLLFNSKAFFFIDNHHVSARYHWFGRLECDIDEIAFALAQTNTLTLLLKNGKRHIIMGIENPWPLCSAIRRKTFSVEKGSPNAVREQLNSLKANRKKSLLVVLGGIVLMFAIIFITVFLTDGKDLPDFNKLDWTIMAIMGFLELLTIIGTLYAAQTTGKKLLPIEHLKYRLRGALIAAQPLPFGNAKRIFTDENHAGRLIVFGFPGDQSVYYCVQEFLADFMLKTVHTSEVYQSEEDMPTEAIESFIDITSQFI